MIRESMDFQGPDGSVPALFARVRMPGNFDDRSAQVVFGGGGDVATAR